MSRLAIAGLALGAIWLSSAGGAQAITITKTFTNHTGVTVNDLHWEFNTVETVTAINKDGWNVGTSGTDPNNNITYLDFSGMNLVNGASTTVGVTFADTNSSERQAYWTIGGVPAGSAYTPFSYRGAWGAATQEWVVALDNKDVVSAGRLLVKNLRFAVSGIKFDANTLPGATLTFGAPQPDFVVEVGVEEVFNVFTGAGSLYVVADGDLEWVDAGGVPIAGTESHFRGQVVPEPSVGLLLVAALAGLAALRRHGIGARRLG